MMNKVGRSRVSRASLLEGKLMLESMSLLVSWQQGPGPLKDLRPRHPL